MTVFGQRGDRIDASVLLSGLVGKTIITMTGKPNHVLRIEGDQVIVGTSKTPGGAPVDIADIQDALDRLIEEREIEISVASVGYRSAFVGAVLSTLPGATPSTNPRMIRLGGRRR